MFHLNSVNSVNSVNSSMFGHTLLPLLLLLLTAPNFVNAAAWVAGFQSSGFVGWNLRQYTHLFEGNPRQVATLLGADSSDSLPGVVCGDWLEFKIIGNSNPGQYVFNCLPTPSEINANAHTNGFYIGGLNHEGVTMALCHIEYSASELCDSDTVTDSNDEACNVWVVCDIPSPFLLVKYPTF
ncbi:hypothetical protein F5050DRAFT_1716058 [Lentinula boryana]|uniref:Uncharacterized protein n=1 Tax=Lentinula boryana TaxID=40481 RepID=A0ABQ8PYH1_9AGAR|nr:hypothetical protein F5050DRAFT_1716058 [Lentinula boryana]